MVQFSQVLLVFCVIFVTLGVFGQNDVEYIYDSDEEGQDSSAVSTTDPVPAQVATVAPQRPPSTTLSPDQEVDESIVARITARLNAAEKERNALNQTLEWMQSQMNRFRNLVQSPISAPSPPSSGGKNNSVSQPGGSSAQVQTNAKLIRKLENEIKSLKNETLRNRQSRALNHVLVSTSTGRPDDRDIPIPEVLQEEIQDLGEKIEALNTSLSNTILENVDRFRTELINVAKPVEELLRIWNENRLNKTLEDLLQSYGKNEMDRAKSLLDDLSKINELDSSMPEIVRRMFNGNILNYPRILAFFKSTKKNQYKSGLTSLIGFFQTVSSSSSFVDDPNLLRLAYVAKDDFANELQSKFPQLMQNLVFKEKVSFRNLQTNLCLLVDRAAGLQTNGYSVLTRLKTSINPATACDWEILPMREGESFIIRQKNQGQSQAEALNLNVLERAVSAATARYNQNYLWKIHIRKNAQEVTLQNVPASSDVTPYFLCSAPAPTGSGLRAGRTRRAVQLMANGEAKACTWFIDS